MSMPTDQVRALLLAGGLGTRLRPLTDTMPKCLVPIGGQAILDYWIDLLADAGVREARINTHALAERVAAYIESVNREGQVHLVESFEPTLLGSGGTVAANADLADGAEAIIIIYADNLSDVDLGAMLAFHRSHDDPFTMLLFRASDPRACGIAELDESGRIVSFVEKPAEPRSDLANAGIYIVDADAYREIARMGAFDLGFEVLPRFVGRMRGWLHSGYHRDIGTPRALVEAQRDATALLAARGRPAPVRRPAVFLDRDGTLIEHVHYLADPAHVRLLPGAAEAVRRLREAGFACVLVTNQSAIARGLLTEDGLREIHREQARQLAEAGTELDAIYYCPEAPASDDRTAVEHPDRKPGPGMLLRAAEEMGLDLARSWMVGDLISDALAGRNAGCKGSLLVRTGKSNGLANAGDDFEICDDLPEAARRILGRHGTVLDAIQPPDRVGDGTGGSAREASDTVGAYAPEIRTLS
jgi:D,D-heptose 1,7-bisphosphate phosphatase